MIKAVRVLQIAVGVWLVSNLFMVNSAAQQKSRQVSRPGEIEVNSSRVFTLVKATGMEKSHGVEAKLSYGSLVLGATENAGEFVIDMKTFDADTPLARRTVGLEGTMANWMRTQVTKEIHDRKILNSSKFPTATFDIRSCEPIGVTNNASLLRYQLTGTFTLRGVSKPLSFPISVEQTQGWLHLKGHFSFRQSDYGIEPISKGFGTIGVEDKLTVFGDLWVAPTQESLASMQSLLRR